MQRNKGSLSTSRLLRWGQGIVAFVALFAAMAAQAAGVCATSGSSGYGASVFGTYANWIDGDSSCAGTKFYNVPAFWAKSSDQKTVSSPACVNATTGAAIKYTESNPTTQTLPTFQTSSAASQTVGLLGSPFYQFNANWGSSYSYLSLTNANQSITLNGRPMTVPAKNQPLIVPSDVYTDWGWFNLTSASVTFKATANSDIHIDRISTSSCGSGQTVTFTGPATYWINLWQGSGDACNVVVTGGPVTLRINSRVDFGGLNTQTCVNWTGTCTAAITPAIMAAQHPENLKIYTPQVFTADDTRMAAGLYSGTGYAQLYSVNSGQTAYAGELVGGQVSYDTANSSNYIYMNTGMFGTSAPPVRQGTYQLSAAAVPALAQTGSYAYLAQQVDVNSSGATAYAGHLYADAIQADGSLAATPAWDAAALMTVAQRQATLYTVGASGSLIKLQAAQSNLALLPATVAAQMATNGANAIGALINPNAQSGAWLAGRDAASLMGRPLRSAPFLAGQAIVVGSEDGFLYGFDKDTGALLWGFIPPELLPSTQTAGALLNTNPWGQGAYAVSGGNRYVVATAMQGAVHVSLKINADGTLNALGWEDYLATGASPSTPVGGAAPSVAIDQTGTSAGKVAYVVNNILKRVPVSTLTGAAATALTTTATSNVLYVSDAALYYGDSAGAVKGVLGASDAGTLGESPANPVLWLTGAYSQTTSATPTLLLAAASTTKAGVFTTAGGSGSSLLWQFSSSSTSGAPSLPSGYAISSMPSISGGLVYLGITTGTDFCSQSASEVGPLLLSSGQSVLSGTTFRGASLGTAINVLGAGEALFAPTTMLNGKMVVFGDANGGGTSVASTGWAAYKTLKPPVDMSNKRLGWREMTSFVVGLLRDLGWPSAADAVNEKFDFMA